MMNVISPSLDAVRSAIASRTIQADVSTTLPNNETTYRNLMDRGVECGLDLRVIYAVHLAAGGSIPASSDPVNPLNTEFAKFFC